MKICFLNHTLDDSTGAGHFGRSLLRALGELDPSLEYVVLTQLASGAPDELRLIFPRWERQLVSLPRIRSVFGRYDIIHALDGYPFGVIAALAAVGLKQKFVITAIGTGALQPLSRPVVGRLLWWAYRRADQIAAVSRYTRRELLRIMPDLEISVVNHGVDIDEFQKGGMPALPESERSEIQKLKPYVLSVGAFKPRKGFRYSLQAVSEACRSFPLLRYVIVGSGDRRELDGAIRRLGLGARVRFFTNVSRNFLVALYREAEVFLLLPQDDRGDVEGFGLVFLEAAAAGIPVVGARSGGAEDAVAHGRNGLLVPPRDAAAAAAALGRILSNPQFKRRLSNGSLELAKTMSWSRAARSYHHLYQRLLSRS